MEIIRPATLRKGDTVAFVSPSFRGNEIIPSALSRAQAYLEGQGFRVITIYSSIEHLPYHEKVLKRVEELHRAFKDPSIQGIICTAGGSTSNQLLRFLDFDLIKQNPKVFVGYSDITVLHWAILARCGLQTFYGPCAIDELGDQMHTEDVLSRWSTNHLMCVISSAKPLGQIPVSQVWSDEDPACFADPDSEATRGWQDNPGWTWLRHGKAKGRIIGGCLEPIMHMLAAPQFRPSFEGAILFIESALADHDPSQGPDLDRIQHEIADIANAGIFDAIQGLIIGRPHGTNHNSEEGRQAYLQTFLDGVSEWRWPILFGVDIGHTSPMVTIPLGSECVLDSELNTFEVWQ